MAGRDYMGGSGRFSGHSSGKTKSFGVSLHQIRDVILKKAPAKGELPENFFDRQYHKVKVRHGDQNFGNFYDKQPPRASEDPKMRRGPALTRNLKIPRGL